MGLKLRLFRYIEVLDRDFLLLKISNSSKELPVMSTEYIRLARVLKALGVHENTACWILTSLVQSKECI